MATTDSTPRTIRGLEPTIFPLCLGANVFGWTVDQDGTSQVLDAFVAAGGNLIDTADVYPAWAPGNVGGESEAMIGTWLAARGPHMRERVLIATKVGKLPSRPGLSAENIRVAADESLARLGTDHIDLYYAHADDESVPLEETLGAFDELVRAGKVRAIAASNYSAERLAQALAVSEREGFASYVAVQPHYNLLERRHYEGPEQKVAHEHGLACVPYYGLASGFLAGKYREGQATPDSPRAGTAAKYGDERGQRVLAALDAVAAEHDVAVGAIALAWLAAQDTVVAPIASARTVEQLEQLLDIARVELSAGQLDALNVASR